MSYSEGMFYDYDANPISMEEWAELRHAMMIYPEAVRWQVARTTLPDGSEVSTVWLGVDHSLAFEPPPLIFETATFAPGGSLQEIDGRYADAESAMYGHEHIVKMRLAGL